MTVEKVGRDDARIGEGGVPFDRVAAAAWSGFGEATLVTLDGEKLDPVTITVDGPGEGVTAAGHLHIRTTPHTQATVVVVHRGRACWPTTPRSCWVTVRTSHWS